MNTSQEYGRLLAVDSDMVLFSAMSSAESEAQLADGLWHYACDHVKALQEYWDTINGWCSELNIQPHNVAHCFSHRSAFRRRIFPNYKQSRTGKRKPCGYAHLRATLLDQPNAFCYEEIEADDIIGLFATMPESDVIIASGDKDLDQVPGWHIWKDKEPYFITNDHAERFTYQQYLQGDSTDSIPGCKGVGEVGAKKAVQDFDLTDPVGCWEAVVRLYEKKGQVDNPHVYALTQARLTRILRWGEYDFNNHVVKPWTPQTQMPLSA